MSQDSDSYSDVALDLDLENPPEEQLEMDGPFWVHWPSSEPFPEPYTALERIVRP